MDNRPFVKGSPDRYQSAWNQRTQVFCVQLLGGFTLGSLLLLPVIYYLIDFKRWRALGTGGTPPTFRGYVKIKRWGYYNLWRRNDLKDVSMLPTNGPAYLNHDLVPCRSGRRPTMTQWALPQRQWPEPITSEALERLNNLMKDFAAKHVKYLRHGPSKTEGGTGPAIYVLPDVKHINPLASKIFYEVAHVHPSDHSLHVYLSALDARLVIQQGWGRRFPIDWLAPASWIMVYAPRDEGDLEVIERIVKAAGLFATGGDLGESDSLD
ncbi:hypothetical protein K469DRAFT_691222 [Zopfia rhizophila CBS 207.26]|uniref:Luciferase domain-containing protein n=1 Tax=Zopfia rhizophila CBS 207.26 TaxID=1314779 RepID=A0A6A6EUC6_9PEZI|nr:hypothetical protein K469DRAFT_691222 [Zopfia rhizophila CBS 207.26]